MIRSAVYGSNDAGPLAFACPHCGLETEVWSRVTGYLRPVANYNDGKKQEYFDRKKFRVSAAALEEQETSPAEYVA